MDRPYTLYIPAAGAQASYPLAHSHGSRPAHRGVAHASGGDGPIEPEHGVALTQCSGTCLDAGGPVGIEPIPARLAVNELTE